MIVWKDASFKIISEINPETIVLIPIGTIEAHGNHLPLNTDTLIPQHLCREITKKINSVIAPEINFGICDSLIKFPGTIAFRPQTLTMLLNDYLNSIIGYGFKNIYILNGHGGNEEVLANIVKTFSPKVKIRSKDWYDFDFIRQLKISDHSYHGDHADRMETEMVLHSDATKVDLNQAVDDYFEWPDSDPVEYSKIMTHAVYGYPSKADPVSAKNNFNKIVDLLVQDINNFLINK